MPRASIIIFLVLFAGLFAQSQIPDICLTKDEYRLYTLVNEKRVAKGLSVIPISKSLSYVAQLHARDLFYHNPDTSFCSLNSWSDQGNWIACCHSKNTPKPACILKKPSELTNYTSEGHELCFWDSETLNPDTVIKFWISVDLTKEIIMNEKKWGYFKWNAMGVGMYKGYVCLWLGEAIDPEPEPTLCTSEVDAAKITLPSQQADSNEFVSASTGRYYLIFGSYKSETDARKELARFRKAGFTSCKIIVKDNLFRVSLNDFSTQQEALNTRKQLGENYKAAWITKF